MRIFRTRKCTSASIVIGGMEWKRQVNRMAREILFKAKRKDNGEWVEGYLVKCRTSEEEVYAIKDTVYHVNDGIINLIPCVVDESTICQYTGLTDKNGNKIWENDIVRYQFDTDDCIFPNKDTKKRVGKIFFSDFRASFSVAMGRNGSKAINNDLFKYVQNGNRVEVIGNIFDNPELIGK